jgi:glyoxylase-like metal-dependent hydrolase (beta-lactamase superfamily II)
VKTDHRIETFSTSGGGRIYRLPLEAFPGFWAYAYWVHVDDYRVLIDTGSGYGLSNENLESGFVEAGIIDSGEPARLDGLTHIFVTHGHIDHFGGLNYVLPRTRANLGVHDLDLRVLTHYEERLAVVSRRLEEYLIEAGVSEQPREHMLAMYRFTKELYHSVQVNFTYEAVDMHVGPFEFLHVPGHSAGHVVIRLHDVIFCGDHVISSISPHQAPEHLTLGTGLDHYLHSLDLVDRWSGPVRLTLSGHSRPIENLSTRIGEIKTIHAERLSRVLDFFEEPHTIDELSRSLFGEVNGYNVLLAIEEAGAHVEYLYQRGKLCIENLNDLDSTSSPTPIRYRRA